MYGETSSLEQANNAVEAQMVGTQTHLWSAVITLKVLS
jgi:hypothetical protein